MHIYELAIYIMGRRKLLIIYLILVNSSKCLEISEDILFQCQVLFGDKTKEYRYVNFISYVGIQIRQFDVCSMSFPCSYPHGRQYH